MIIDFAELSPSQAYFTMIQTVIPRPIAWVLSVNEGGNYNLAPFSYFNAVCSDPPLLLISVGKKPDGSFKDTRVNIEQRNEFVVHIAHRGLLDELNDSAATLPYGESELEITALATQDFPGSTVPRIAEAHIAFACSLHEIKEIGSVPQSLIFGLVKAVYVDDAVLGADHRGRRKIIADRVDPLARLGGEEFVLFGEITRRRRPT